MVSLARILRDFRGWNCIYMASTLEVCRWRLTPNGRPSELPAAYLLRRRVRPVPDWACELKRRPNHAGLSLVLDGHGTHLQAPHQEPESLAGLVGQ